MRIRGWWLFVGLMGCGSGATVNVTMQQINNSGENGTAVLKDLGGGQTQVTINLSQGTDTGVQTVHIHDGTCPGLGAIRYALTPLTNGNSVSTVDAGLSDLRGGQFVINAHNSVTPSTYVSCGTIP